MRTNKIVGTIFLGLIVLMLSSCPGIGVAVIIHSLYLPISLPDNYKSLELTTQSTEISSLNYIDYSFDSVITYSEFNSLYPDEIISNSDSILVFDDIGSIDFSEDFIVP